MSLSIWRWFWMLTPGVSSVGIWGAPLHAELATSGAADGAQRTELVEPGELIHHSDRGVQYACSDYIDLLEQGEIQISMSRRGNPYDNARAERFMRTLKEEEIHGSDYRDLEDARSRIGEFLEQVYNRQRLHSALRYLTPEEFEQASKADESDGSDGSGGKPTTGLPPLHRPWKSLFRISTLRRSCDCLSINEAKTGRSVTQLIAFQRVPA